MAWLRDLLDRITGWVQEHVLDRFEKGDDDG